MKLFKKSKKEQPTVKPVNLAQELFNALATYKRVQQKERYDYLSQRTNSDLSELERRDLKFLKWKFEPETGNATPLTK